MQHLRAAFSFFGHTRLRHWPGLAFYFFGWMCYRILGVRLFQERRLHLKNLVINADVEGQSGLIFLHEILIQQIYDVAPISQAEGIRVVFDAGANCGFYSLVTVLQHPERRVFCFEPHPVTFTRLQQNIRCNGLENRITPVQAAAGSAPGRCTLETSVASSMGVVTASQVAAGHRLVEVPMVSLDDYARTQSLYPDLIKIDVEGFEVEVLKGARICLEKARYVILEVHSDELARDSLQLLHEARFQTRQQGALIFANK